LVLQVPPQPSSSPGHLPEQSGVQLAQLPFMQLPLLTVQSTQVCPYWPQAVSVIPSRQAEPSVEQHPTQDLGSQRQPPAWHIVPGPHPASQTGPASTKTLVLSR